MGAPMSDRQRQQRAAMIVGGAAVGGLAIIGLAIALSSGGDDSTNAIDVRRTTTTSSSTTSSSTTTSTSTSTTTTLVTLPATVPPTSPPTIITVPPAPPTSPTTAAPTTSPPTTEPATTTTKPPTPAQQLALTLDSALNGGQPDAPPRVTVKPLGNSKTLDVTWKLDASLPPDEQQHQAREDALVLLQTIQAENPPSNDNMRLKATIPKPESDRVILLVIDRSQFDAFDFSSFDPDTTDIFTLPFIESSDINETYVPNPYPPSSTTTTDGTTTTTDETTTTT
jgi:hypothetical protein